MVSERRPVFQGSAQNHRLIAVAWRALSLVISASPIGRILALAGALALLFDDYQVWKNGGKSLIDWGNWTSEIDKAVFAINRLSESLEKLAKFLGFSDAKKYIDGSIQEARDLGDMADAAMRGDWDGIKKVWADRKARQRETGLSVDPEEVRDSRFGPFFRSGDTGNRKPGSAVEPPEIRNNRSGSPDKPRGIRNNNPGNLNFVGQRGATREGGDNGRFATWQTAHEGLQALANQLRLYSDRGLDSIRKVINTYAPSSENDTSAYINQLAMFMGIDPDETFDVKSDPAALAMLMQGIIKHENGYNPYSRDQINEAIGSSELVGRGGAQVSQKTDIHIHGVSDPQAAGQAVSREQGSVNERLVRNLRGAVQ